MPALRSFARALVMTSTLTALAAPAAATTTENFTLRSGADVVALCSTPTADPLYTAAIHLCQGFGAGVYQTILALTTRAELEPMLCPPNPPPSRNQEIEKFLAWAKQNSQHLTEAPVDVVGRFLVEQFPCPKAAK